MSTKGVSPVEDKYQTEDDARTLMHAAEIHQDKNRHKKAKAHLKKQQAAIKQAINPFGGVMKDDDED